MLKPLRCRTLRVVLVGILALLSGPTFAQTVLKVSAIPDENPTELLRVRAAKVSTWKAGLA
jgi:hypothetical protein